MSFTASMEINGLRETLRELNKMQPELRKQLNDEFNTIVKPVVDAIKTAVPGQPPLSGMARKWKTESGRNIFPWKPESIQKSVTTKIDTRRQGSALGVMKIVMKSSAGTIYDMAGKHGGNTAKGQAMIRNLGGSPSRFMWPTYERNAHLVQKEMEQYAAKVMDIVNRRMGSIWP